MWRPRKTRGSSSGARLRASRPPPSPGGGRMGGTSALPQAQVRSYLQCVVLAFTFELLLSNNDSTPKFRHDTFVVKMCHISRFSNSYPRRAHRVSTTDFQKINFLVSNEQYALWLQYDKLGFFFWSLAPALLPTVCGVGVIKLGGIFCVSLKKLMSVKPILLSVIGIVILLDEFWLFWNFLVKIGWTSLS